MDSHTGKLDPARFVLLLVFVFMFLPAAAAAMPTAENPAIESLEVRATFTKQGVLSVEETLFVLFDGQPLSQDLTRGISGHYAKGGRAKSKTGFVLLNSTLDELSTKILIRRNPESLRLILASKGTTFSAGLHVFKLRYELINMIVFHPEQDTLIWRLVGESSCRIQRIDVRAELPGSLPFRLFSGQFGNFREGQNLNTNPSGSLFSTWPLSEGESFTLYLAWDKGLVMDQTLTDSGWRTWDMVVLASLFCYYLFVWLRYGRQPRRQEASLITQPPENLSPGLLRALKAARPDARALTAEILNLAVRGHIHIHDFSADEKHREDEKSRQGKKRDSSLERMMKRRYLLRLNLNPEDCIDLNTTEKLLLHNLFHRYGDADLILDESAAERIKRTFRALVRDFAEAGSRFFFRNMKLWSAGVFAFEAYTAFVMFLVLSQGVGGLEPDSEHALAFMAPLFFLAPFLGGEKIWKQSTPVFIIRTCIPLFFCASALAILRQQGTHFMSIAALIGCIVVIGFFWKLAPVRSEEGLRLLEQIEGFQMGLGSRAELKEGDTLEKFESLFPYACAFDQERVLIARYDPLISRLRHHSRWHTADKYSFSGAAEYYSMAYEINEAIASILRR